MPHPAGRLNALRVVRNETKIFEVSVKGQDGRAVNLSEAVLYMSVGTQGSAPSITKQSGSGIETTDAKAGKAEVTLSSADTASLPAGTYKWDLWVSLPGDIRHIVVKLADFLLSDAMTRF